MREFLKGFLLGAVQGVTEFFPVSSTAHLIIVSELLGISDEVRVSFDISVQVSSVFALIAALSSRLKSLIQDRNELKETLLVVALACLWFIGVAVFFEDVIKTHFFVSSKVWFGLILGSIFLLLGLLKQQPAKAGFWKVVLFVGFLSVAGNFPRGKQIGRCYCRGALSWLEF
jgi:undecaprenyl-diphosphatase